MEHLNKALVTGATSGIGEAIVRTLAASGREVLAVARREDRLRALAEATGASTLSADVRDLPRLTEAIETFQPDIVVNNAGVGHGIDGLSNIGPELVQEAVDINVTAPMQITAAALVGMKSRGRGHIVNIGSIAGLHTLVSAIYGGTKGAVHLFSQNLRYELVSSGIRVTEICPGRVASEFYYAAAGDREKLDALAVTGIRELAPEDVAAAVLYAVDAPDHVNIGTIELMPTDQAIGGLRIAASDE